MGSTTKLNVAIFVPGNGVPSMRDEIKNGSVQRVADAALTAYRGLDSDNDVPVLTYSGGDLDDAIVEAERYANGTQGRDLIVIVTDFESDDHAKAVRTLRGSDNMFVLGRCSNQPVDEAFAAELDADHEGPNNVDVIDEAGFADRSVAMAEVGPFLARTAS